jgi:PAS domain S-box-containing protein
MSTTQNPQPNLPATPARLAEELSSASLDKREVVQNTRDDVQDSRETDQDTRDDAQDSRQSGQDMRIADQELRNSSQNTRKAEQNLRRSGQDTRETGQNLRETGQNLRETGQNLRETEQNLRETRMALAESEEWFRLLVESVTDYAIYMLDPQGNVVTWNVGAERSKGYKAEEILGRNYSIFFLPEDAEAGLPAQELAAAASADRYETEAWRLRKDGAKFWALVTLTAIRGAGGELRGFAKVTRDMSERKVAEEAVRSHNAELERYRIIIENITDYVIYTLDAEGRIDSWSPGLQELLGYTAEEGIRQDYSMSFPAAEIEAGEPRRQLEEAARTRRCATEGWRERKDGSRFWSIGVLTALRDEVGNLTGYIRVTRDMTQQKILEDSLEGMAADLEIRVTERTRELEATVAELQRKNQEVEAFVHIVSHDLRAPLVNVQGFVRELEESCKHLKAVIQACPNWEQCWGGVQPVLDEEIGGALHYISASTTKFERLINALLGLSRQGRHLYQLARVNVWELATNSVATFQQAITEAGAEVQVGQLPSVTADATALGQVFSNLIGNTLKYRSPERPLRVEVGGHVEEGMVHYWVRDNGLGIPEYGKVKLFQVFQRFHSQQAEGEGMGLAIAHRIVERHGGKIWAESREGEGTTFHFSLPANPVVLPRITQGTNDHECV